MEDLIFATKNPGKLREIKALLLDSPYNVVSMAEAGIDAEVDETGETFEENAVLKAAEICRITGKLTLADDSGLEIDFLDRKPGVQSARFMGRDTPYEIKNKQILELLANAPDEKRTARFVSVIAAAFPSGEVKTTYGVIEGIIAREAKGNNGFGYDPIFFVPELGMTTAEIPPDIKNKISHRGKALTEMKSLLKKK